MTSLPACATWELPTREMSFYEWQNGRCGICGKTPEKIVRDHDHKTGLERGHLCRSCNAKEVHSVHPAFVAWRAGCNPPTLLNQITFKDDPTRLPIRHTHPFRATNALWESLKAKAQDKGLRVSQAIIQALEDWLAKP